MPERAFEIIDHTADVGIVAYGTDVKELFRNAALGLFSLVTDTRQIEESLRRDLKIASTDHVGLLVEWLNELIYLLDTEHILFNRFVIEQLTNDHLEATCYGEKVDPRR
ncbi:MAG: archease, partial [Chloroflexi bacterium]|nr:archease [Chloroflexota bacterium]